MEETTQVQAPTVRSVGIRYGFILAVIGIILFLVFIFSGADMTSGWIRWTGYPIYIVLVVLAHNYFKANGDGFMSYGQGIGIAFWTGLISSVVSSLFTYIYLKFIDSGMIEMIRQAQIEELEKKGMSDEQIEQTMKFVSMFTTPEMMLVFGVIGGVVGIVICGLIVSIFTQKKQPESTF